MKTPRLAAAALASLALAACGDRAEPAAPRAVAAPALPLAVAAPEPPRSPPPQAEPARPPTPEEVAEFNRPAPK
jgi:hypothetical protein